jgi:hypothetical protein
VQLLVLDTIRIECVCSISKALIFCLLSLEHAWYSPYYLQCSTFSIPQSQRSGFRFWVYSTSVRRRVSPKPSGAKQWSRLALVRASSQIENPLAKDITADAQYRYHIQHEKGSNFLIFFFCDMVNSLHRVRCTGDSFLIQEPREWFTRFSALLCCRAIWKGDALG